jgi:putative ABC transport system ATP-binding protein
VTEAIVDTAPNGVILTNVTKRFRVGETTVMALDAVSLLVPRAGFVALTGPSGSGKSTLLHLVGAMDTADEGSIFVCGSEVTALSHAERVGYRRTVGFVFQKFHLLQSLTARDNVVVPVLPFKTRFSKQERAVELLESVGLGERHGRALPSELSGGEQQRVAIARALVNDPAVILADEPTGNLDSQTGHEIVELLLRLRTERDITILIATHDPEVARRCDYRVQLRDGKLAGDDDGRAAANADAGAP